jgi:hypothetical protein
MGLAADLNLDLTAAFNGDLADAVKVFTYRETEETFDVASNTVEVVDTDYSSRGVFTNVKIKSEANEAYLKSTTLIIVLQNELDIIPKNNDKIIKDGTTYIIEDVKEDPVNVTWELLCRR